MHFTSLPQIVQLSSVKESVQSYQASGGWGRQQMLFAISTAMQSVEWNYKFDFPQNVCMKR